MAFPRSVKTGLLVTVLSLSGLAVPGMAGAQSYNDRAYNEQVSAERLQRIENAIRDLQGVVYSVEGGQFQPGQNIQGRAALPGMESPSASLTVRVSQIERELQTLTGRVEELTYRIEQNTRRMETMSEAISMMNRPRDDFGNADPYAEGDDGSSLLFEPGMDNGGMDGQDGFGGQDGNGGPMNGSMPTRPAASGAPADLRGSGLPQGVDSPFPTVQEDAVPADPDAAYDEAFNALLSADYEAAERGFAGFLQQFPDDPRAADAQYRLGEIYLATNANSRAAVAFIDHIKKWPDDPRAAESYLKLGISYARLGKTSEACQIFTATESKFPGMSADLSDRLAIERGKAGC